MANDRSGWLGGLRSAYSFGIIALAAQERALQAVRADWVMAVRRRGGVGRRTTISSPTPMVPGLLTVA